MVSEIDEKPIGRLDDELLDAVDIAAFIGRSTARAYQLMAAGQIPTVRFGRSVRVSRRALERWIEGQSAASSEEEHDAAA